MQAKSKRRQCRYIKDQYHERTTPTRETKAKSNRYEPNMHTTAYKRKRQSVAAMNTHCGQVLAGSFRVDWGENVDSFPDIQSLAYQFFATYNTEKGQIEIRLEPTR